MSDANQTQPQQEKPKDPISTWMGVGAIVLLGLPLMILSQRTFGLWEPWETTWAELAQNMSEHGQWFYPTLGSEGQLAAPRPLLPIWAIAMAQMALGTSEWAMRLPMALSILGGSAALFVWLRQLFGGLRALLAAIAALTCPLIFLGGVTLAGNGVFTGALMATVAVYGMMLAQGDDKPRSALLPAGLGALLAIDALAWGLWGLWLPLSMIVGLGLADQARRQAQQDDPTNDKAALGAAAGAIAGSAALVFWAWSAQNQAGATQWVALLLPPLWLAVGAFAARKSTPLKAFGGVVGAASALVPSLVAVGAVAYFYSSAAPEDSLTGKSATLTFLLENHLLTVKALPEHVTFDFWVRQIGFAAYPWTALLPLGLAYVIRSDESEEGSQEPTRLGLGLLAMWFVCAVVGSLLLGTVHEQYLFPGTAAMGLMAALALSDGQFWQWLRQRPFLMRAVGFTALMIVLFLSKDLERYPRELLGPLLTDGKFEAPEDFSFGSILKAVRYGLLAFFGVWFMGALEWPERLWRWRAAKGTPAAAQKASEDDAAGVDADENGDKGPQPPPWMSALTRLGQQPAVLATSATVLALVVVGLTGMRWVPALSQHLSQRVLVDAYEAYKQGQEPLLVYESGVRSGSYYFADNERIKTQVDLKERFAKANGERFFLVLPADQLSSVHHELRKASKAKPPRGLNVIDSRSSRYVLASNLLREGEEEQSLVTRALLPQRPRPVYPITPLNDKKEKVYTQFDKKVQLLGYEVYREDQVDRWGDPLPGARDELKGLKSKKQTPVFKTGGKFVIRYYFKVLKRVTSSYQIFLHVDYPGNRINGDHVPVNGELPTNLWQPGDYIVDTQWLDIEPGSTTGQYTMYMGFFLGSRRMKITPATGQDGSDRIKLGTIQIENF